MESADICLEVCFQLNTTELNTYMYKKITCLKYHEKYMMSWSTRGNFVRAGQGRLWAELTVIFGLQLTVEGTLNSRAGVG